MTPTETLKALMASAKPCVSVEEMCRNAAHTRTLGLPAVEYAGNVAVVGGGPSLADHLDELKAWDGPIWSINATWAWLKERGISSTFFTIDPKPQSISLGKGDNALVASSGCADLFAALSRGNVRTFDLAFDVSDAIQTGVTSATATPHLAAKLGHVGVTFFGCDSSFEGDTSHVFSDMLPDGVLVIDVGGQTFATKGEFIMQAEHLSSLCREFPAFCHNRSGGLLAALIDNPEWSLAGIKERV
jgi:hypothetical protein